MQLHLEGLTVLVTGGTKGIGRSIVQAFLREGANVAYCARSIPDAAQFESLTQNGKTKAVGTALDVSDAAKVKEWVESMLKAFGSIDVVVPNVSALSPEDWDKTYNVDLKSSVDLIELCIPHLKASKAAGGGSVVVVGSVSGHEIDAFAPGPYGAFKAALSHYVQGMARKHAADKIRLNTVSPGNIMFEGGVWDNIQKNQPDFYKSCLDLNPTGRMGKPEEVADAVVFLSSSVSSFTTGANLLLDGALHKGVAF